MKYEPKKPGFSNLSLQARFSILTVLVVLLAGTAFIALSVQRHDAMTQQNALNEARTLNMEMLAVWDYVDSIQNQINYDDAGRFNFKNVYCATAARNIANRFTKSSDYTIRYVRENPRLRSDRPDEFETQALAAFAEEGVSEYYGVSTYEDELTFRYISVLRYSANCLNCHGSPAGEKDVTGFFKEGMAFGDIAGAASIVVPLDNYKIAERKNLTHDVFFFLLLVAILAVAVNVAFRIWVARPLERIEYATSRLGEGDWQEANRVLSIRSHGEFASLAASFEDMSNKLRESQESLEEKVQLRTRDLSIANNSLEAQRVQLNQAYEDIRETNSQLQSVLQYKSDFLSIMSHELKTPVAAILASLSIWEHERDSNQYADEAMLEDVRLNCQELHLMIANILDAAKMESGRLVIQNEAVDLVDLLGAISVAVNSRAQAKRIDFDWFVDDSVPVINCDPIILKRVLDNIVNNALKFTGEGGSVTINARLVSSQEDSNDNGSDLVSIAISDTGIGIPPEDHERIFDRFTQVNSTVTRTFSGSGLGLSVSREMACALGGNVRVESVLGKGSTFFVEIPTNCNDNPDGEAE